MKFFALFIYRPVATILISIAITLCGVLGFRLLPVAPLPQVDFPVIMVSASLPGASPETMASSVATPLVLKALFTKMPPQPHPSQLQ